MRPQPQIDILESDSISGMMVGLMPDDLPLTQQELEEWKAFFATPLVGLPQPTTVQTAGHPEKAERVLLVVWEVGQGVRITTDLMDIVRGLATHWLTARQRAAGTTP